MKIISILEEIVKRKSNLKIEGEEGFDTGFFGFPLEDLKSIEQLGVLPYGKSPRKEKDVMEIWSAALGVANKDRRKVIENFMKYSGKIDKNKVSISLIGRVNGLGPIIWRYNQTSTYLLGYGAAKGREDKITAIIKNSSKLPGFKKYLREDDSSTCGFGFYVDSIPSLMIVGYIVSSDNQIREIKKVVGDKPIWKVNKRGVLDKYE